MDPITVVLADDHAMLRAGLRRLIQDESDLEVVGETGTGRGAIELAERLLPDVVVMDLTMPDMDGVEATQAIVASMPDTRVLVLTMHEERAYVDRVLKMGAVGYVLKKAADTDLIRAIRSVCSGAAYVDPEVAQPFIDGYLQRRGGRDNRSALSPREEEVLQLVVWGYTAREIADRLAISVKTVESHKERVMDKLGLHTRSELVRFGMSAGLLDTPPD